MVDKRLKIYFEDACEILDTLGIEYGPIVDVKVNSRYKATWGTTRLSYIDGTFTIQISSMLLDSNASYECMMDTMIHEVLHCHKDRMEHGGEWKRCANLVNKSFGYHIKRATSAAEKNLESVEQMSLKYIVVCDGCGAMNGYKKRGKVINALLKNPVGTCTCQICGGQSFTVKSV